MINWTILNSHKGLKKKVKVVLKMHLFYFWKHICHYITRIYYHFYLTLLHHLEIDKKTDEYKLTSSFLAQFKGVYCRGKISTFQSLMNGLTDTWLIFNFKINNLIDGKLITMVNWAIPSSHISLKRTVSRVKTVYMFYFWEHFCHYITCMLSFAFETVTSSWDL